MNVRMIVRLNFLILSFLLVLYFMYVLNSGGLEKSWNRILGVEKGSHPAPQKSWERKASSR